MWTPAERRGAAMLLVLLLAGAGWDLHRAIRVPPPSRLPSTAPAAAPVVAPPESLRAGTRSPAAAPAAEPIDLNRASAAELDRLPGIGPVLAARILEHRQRHGPLRSVDELRAVRGVGPRLLERLRPLVTARRAAEGMQPAR